MSKNKRRTTVRVAAAAGMALAMGAANAVPVPVPPIDGPEGIGDRVWYDEDMDGEQDAGEDGIPGVTVNLLDSSGAATLATVLTGVDGWYEFNIEENGQPDNFVIQFELLPGYAFSPFDQVGDSLDSDARADGKTPSFELNGIDSSVDAGMYRVPAPAVLSLLGLGLAGFGFQQRRRIKKA